jgi:hypothetical protein
MSSAIEQKVKQDLAKRLKAQPDDITVKANQSVTWRDGSLGYPQPGMMYTMALVPGHRIKLQHSGKTYEYHTDGNGGRIVYCENPSNIQEPA